MRLHDYLAPALSHLAGRRSFGGAKWTHLSLRDVLPKGRNRKSGVRFPSLGPPFREETGKAGGGSNFVTGYAVWLTLVALLIAHGIATAAPPQSSLRVPPHPAQGDPVRFLFAGPVTLLIPVSLLAASGLIAALAGSLDRMYAFGGRCVRRLDTGFGVPLLWGLLIVFLFFAVVAALFAAKIGPLGVIVLLIGLYFYGLGIGVAATVCGSALAAAFGSAGVDDLSCLRLGLWVFFLASCFPVIGWIAVLIGCAAGLGAVAQSLLTREE